MENPALSNKRGPEFGPADPLYGSYLGKWHTSADGMPLLVKVLDRAEDVVELVEEYVGQGFRISVCCGPGGTRDLTFDDNRTVLLDLASLNRVYEEDGMYVVEGGCRLGAACKQLYEQYGLAVPGGKRFEDGFASHVLLGGYGMLSRLHGLAMDWLYGIEVVVLGKDGKANAALATRDSEDAALRDLFWGHLGTGCDQFGVVTKLFFKELPEAPEEVFQIAVAWDWWSGQLWWRSRWVAVAVSVVVVVEVEVTESAVVVGTGWSVCSAWRERTDSIDAPPLPPVCCGTVSAALAESAAGRPLRSAPPSQPRSPLGPGQVTRGHRAGHRAGNSGW